MKKKIERAKKKISELSEPNFIPFFALFPTAEPGPRLNLTGVKTTNNSSAPCVTRVQLFSRPKLW